MNYEQRIKLLRKEMENVARLKGLNDPQVLRISQEIDHLHNMLNEQKYMSTDKAQKPVHKVKRYDGSKWIKEMSMGYMHSTVSPS